MSLAVRPTVENGRVLCRSCGDKMRLCSGTVIQPGDGVAWLWWLCGGCGSATTAFPFPRRLDGTLDPDA